MTDHIPKVSIGLAVYNGEKYLKQAVDSILTQTFRDIELIISDNASEDGTETICRAYAAQDARIRYHRNSTNIGGANNENLTFKLSHGQYFRNAAHDDVCAPTLIEKCVEVLDRDPSVVLCYTRIVQIDDDGNDIGLLDQRLASSNFPSARFRELYQWEHNCEATYGLVRADVMAKTDLQLNYPDSDRTFLCELSLYGKFHQIDEPLFYKRYHAGMSTNVFPDIRERMAWFNPNFNPKQGFASPPWLQFFHYLRVIAKSPLSQKERLHLFSLMVPWLFLSNRWKWMLIDFVKGIYRSIRSFFNSLNPVKK